MSYEGLNHEELVQVLGDGLLAAICSHDVQRVETFLEMGNISASDIDNIPLGLACRHNDLDIVRSLLKFGVDVNVKPNTERDYNLPEINYEKRKWSAIIFACSEPGDRYELVKCLIEAGCDFHSHGFAINLPIKLAIKNTNIPVVKLLLESGVDVNGCLGQFSVLETPLYMATEQCNEELVELLLGAGASTSQGQNCLDVSLTKYFLKGVEIFRKTKFVQEDLYDGYGYMVRLQAMKNRVDLEFDEDILGFMCGEYEVLPVLHHTCAHRHFDPDVYEDPWRMVQLLLEVITDVHRKDKQGFNCFQYACSRLHLKTIKVLLTNGVTPDTDSWPKMWKCLPPVNERNFEIYPRFLELVKLAGFHVDAETVGKLEQSMISSEVSEGHLAGLREVLRSCNSPLNLKEISRIKVRQCLGGKIGDKLARHLPDVLIEYLEFDHLY